MAKKATNWGAFVLTLVGSLIYLYAVWWTNSNWSNLWWSTAAVNGTAGAAVAPLLFALATVAAIGLFIMSFVGLGMTSDMMRMGAVKAAMGGGVTLIALTIGNSMAFTIVIVGFILATIGANWAKESAMMK